MTPKAALPIIQPLILLRFFPTDAAGVASVAELFASICDTEEHARWLVGELRKRCNDWPGPRTVREIYSLRYRPVDEVGVK